MNNTDREEKIYDLRWSHFAKLFGTAEKECNPACKQMISGMDFRYKILDGEKREQILLDVLKKLDSNHLSVSGRKRKNDWEKGWSQNLQKFIENDQDVLALVPAYVRPDRILRLNHNYITSSDPNFELNFYTVYRQYLFRRYLSDFDSIYEFGCGTGYNLLIMAQMYPDKQFYGMDWAAASRDLVNEIGKTLNPNISGHLFDMFVPNYDLEIDNNSVFITLNSLEQLGDNFESFLQFILSKTPRLCIHAEPIIELYNSEHILDYVAIKYHQKRGYLNNYLSRLKALESTGTIKILKTRRIPFGSLFHEGYSLVIWQPLT
jgi:hypothetical protein